MSNADEFREKAEECRQQAEKAISPRDKAVWLRIAESWLEIVPVSHMDEVLARAMTRKPEPIEWDETTTTAPSI